MKRSSFISVFGYGCYRQFLRDWYNSSKKARRGFSFRLFSSKAGFVSPNFLKLVMDGKRNLTEDSLQKMMKGLGLNKQEQEFFRHLVCYNQAESTEEKTGHYQRMVQSKKYSEIKPLEKHQFDYCKQWYHAAVRELVGHPDFNGPPVWIAEKLFPPVSEAQVIKSLELLERLGMIQKVDQGYCQSHALVSTGAEIASEAVFQYHQAQLDLAKEILHKVSANRRDISALTLGVASSRIPEVKSLIRLFREELLKISSMDTHPEDVVQINIQMFPLTKESSEGAHS